MDRRSPEALWAVLDAVHESCGYEDFLVRLVRAVKETLPCDRTALYVMSARRGAFVPAADYGTPADVVRTFMSRGYEPSTFPGEPELRAGRLVLAVRGHSPGPLQTLLEQARLFALALVPIAYQGEPVGVLACYDIKAQQLLDACRDASIAVPEDVAVLGVDNDPVLCSLTTPPLSSVIPNAQRSGFEAAALLDRMMAGKKEPPTPHLIEPLGIETRQSTDVLAIPDRDVAAALRFIREHACDGIGVAEVLKAVPLSRRVLEQRFQKLLGRTPHDEITRVQIENVKRLLEDSDLPLEAIAGRCGYKHVEYMTVAFKREVGVPPSVWRTER